MKQDIHPEYGPVVFRDKSQSTARKLRRGGADYSFLTRSTVKSNETVEWEDGNTYPVVDVQISAATHPFWTGKSRVLDDEGRVAKFYKKYGQKPKQ